MKGWLGDWARTVGAWWYWNTRKTIFVARGRLGQCPCHNPSDSGAAGETRCEAVVFWRQPRRFSRRVCPLLVQSKEGEWVCSVAPSGVRPFWGKVFASHGIAVVAAVLISGLVVWGGMRWVGFHVSLRQIFWPPSWHELAQVRAELFREKAQAALSAGRPREAVAALLVARQLDPGDLESGLVLAQLLHLLQPEAVDGFYRHLTQEHPARTNEIARSWYRSLLARAQMSGVAELAHAQLLNEPEAGAAWTHALLMAARWERNWALLAGVVDDPKVAADVREVCALELQLRRADFVTGRIVLATQPPPRTRYAVLHRIERLIEFRETFEALDLLQQQRTALAGRDVARLTLAAHAVGKNRAALERESGALLTARGADMAAGVTIVAQHLIRYPDAALLARCHEAFVRLPAGAGRDDAAAALYCAAALAGEFDWLAELRRQFSGESAASLVAQQKIEDKLRAGGWSPIFLLSVVRPVSLDLNYAVLERVMAGGDVPPVPARVPVK
jgi:hypothetical protein